MNVYQLWTTSDYQSLTMLDKRSNELAGKGAKDEIRRQLVSIATLKDTWTPPHVMLQPYWDERRIARPMGDCSDFLDVSDALSGTACETLRDLVEPHAEFLPLQIVSPHHDDLEFYALHVMNEIEALDIGRSKVSLYGERVIGIDDFVFRPEVIGKAPIFRMPHNPQRAIYVTESFRQRVNESGLKGFTFLLHWSDDQNVMAKLEQRHAKVVEKQQAARARRLAQPSVKEQSLSQTDRQAIAAADSEARYYLRCGKNDAPEFVQDRIHNKINEARDSSKTLEVDIERLSMLLGCLWGQTICDAIHWEWIKAVIENETHLAIVACDRSHMILPLQFIGGLLEHPERDQTSRITFKYLKEGQLEPGDPGKYLRFQVKYIVPPQ